MPWVARRHIQALNNNLMIPSDSSQVFEHKFHVVQIQIPPSDRACGNGSEAGSKWNVKFTNKKLNAQALMWNSMVSCFTMKINNHSNFLLFLFSSTLCLTETTCKSDDGSVKNFFQEPPRGGYAILDHCIIHSKCTLSSSHFSSFFQATVRLLFIVNNPARDLVSAHILHHSCAPFPHWFLLLSGRAQESPLAVFFFEWGDSTPRKNVRLIYCNSARDHAKCFFTIHHWLSARNEQFSTKSRVFFSAVQLAHLVDLSETFGVSRAQTTNFY